MADQKLICENCGPRVQASYQVRDVYVCRKHVSAAIEAQVPKDGSVLVTRLRSMAGHLGPRDPETERMVVKLNG